MENKDQFFEQFRQQAEQLRQSPRPEAWQRIEQRMQPKRSQLRSVRSRLGVSPRVFSMAASLALLIGLSTILFWLGKTDSASPGPLAAAQTVTEWEELPSLESTADTPREVVQIAVRYPRPKVAQPIVEGRPDQRLVARNATTPRRVPTDSDSTQQRKEGRMSR
ncbi:MAG: hypothetical protein AAGJ82_07095 [Bacteroidota bacterium]